MLIPIVTGMAVVIAIAREFKTLTSSSNSYSDDDDSIIIVCAYVDTLTCIHMCACIHII